MGHGGSLGGGGGGGGGASVSVGRGLEQPTPTKVCSGICAFNLAGLCDLVVLGQWKTLTGEW